MEEFLELSPQNIFMTVGEHNYTGKNEPRILLSSKCKEKLIEQISYVKIFGNEKAIKIKISEKRPGTFKIVASNDSCFRINSSNKIIQQLKNIGWTLSDGRKFEGEITQDGLIFYRNKILEVRGKQSC